MVKKEKKSFLIYLNIPLSLATVRSSCKQFSAPCWAAVNIGVMPHSSFLSICAPFLKRLCKILKLFLFAASWRGDHLLQSLELTFAPASISRSTTSFRPPLTAEKNNILNKYKGKIS